MANIKSWLFIALLGALFSVPAMADAQQQSARSGTENQYASRDARGHADDAWPAEPGMAIAGFPELSERSSLEPNRVDIFQEGDSNYVKAVQKGNGHVLPIVQQGNQNRITAIQQGNGQAARIQQTGDDNLVNLSQDGFANRAGITQSGQGNTSNVEQLGLHNSVLISQIGNGLVVTVRQQGNYNQAFVVQGD